MKANRILICYNLFNDKKEFKFNCHSQIYGSIEEFYQICTKLSETLNNAKKYDKAWFECYFFNNTGKTISKTSFKIIEKGIYPQELQQIITNNLEKKQ